MSLDMTWQCDACKSQNSIQNSKCRVCGQEIPESVYQKIYEEELASQKKFLRTEKIKKKNERLAKQDVFWKKYNAFYVKHNPKIASGAAFLKKARIVLVALFVVVFCLQFYFLKSNNLHLHSVNITTVISKINENKVEFRELDFSDKESVAQSRGIQEKYHEILQFIHNRISEINEKKERIFNNGN